MTYVFLCFQMWLCGQLFSGAWGTLQTNALWNRLSVSQQILGKELPPSYCILPEAGLALDVTASAAAHVSPAWHLSDITRVLRVATYAT